MNNLLSIFYSVILQLVVLCSFLVTCHASDAEEKLRALCDAYRNKPGIVDEKVLSVLIQQTAAEKNTRLLMLIFKTQEGLIGRQALRAVSLLPEKDLHQLLNLILKEDSFWPNLDYELDDMSELQAEHQVIMANRISIMIHRDVTIHDLYDPTKRQEILPLVEDVLKNGLKKPNDGWKPKKWVPSTDQQPVKLIDDPTRAPKLPVSPSSEMWRHAHTPEAPVKSSKEQESAEDNDPLSHWAWSITVIFVLVAIGGICFKFLRK
jgi:hypothetical protein